MISDSLTPYQKNLGFLKKKRLYRELPNCHARDKDWYPENTKINFSSNDYLALANSAIIKNAMITALENGIPTGATGSRLITGNHTAIATLEEQAAKFFGHEQCLYFSSGYLANLAIFSALPQTNDVIFYDEEIHASAHDGFKLSRAKAVAVKHNTVEQFAMHAKNWRKSNSKGNIWIAVESIYSMTGEIAPLLELSELAQEVGGFLIVDEAHATGIYGLSGRGLTEAFANKNHLITLHTCGKALGVAGALVCTNNIFQDYLINRAKSFIYTTAPSPLLAVGVSAAITLLELQPELSERLIKLIRFANLKCDLLTDLKSTGTQILPVIVKENDKAISMAQKMQVNGFDIRAIRFPTVAMGRAQLRINISLHVTEKEIEEIFSTLIKIVNDEQLCH